jgi:hypothetical protein
MDNGSSEPRYVPDPGQMALWPDVSGNAINGLGETSPRQPSPVYWQEPGSISHGPLQNWFYGRYTQSPEVAAARARRQEIIDRPLPEVARKQRIETPSRWVDLIKGADKSFGADDVGVARMDPSWVFEGHRQDTWTWAIAIAVQHDYDTLKTAPEDPRDRGREPIWTGSKGR